MFTNDKILNLEAIKECIIDYSSPIFIIGDIDLNVKESTVIDANTPKENLIIMGREPAWVRKVFNNRNKEENILIIKNFDDLNLDRQALFMDIIRYNKVSSIDLPNNLKIIINAKKKTKIHPRIFEMIQIFNLE